jgi:hypothetical protein
MPKTAQSLGTGTLISTSCTSTSNSNGGCAFTDSSTASFGKGFNDLQGGVFATRWDKRGISTWRFDRSSIPRDITAKKPNPSGWGTPVAAFPSTDCDMGSHFFDQSLVIDTTLCGDWAGTASVYGASGCPGTCAEAVADPTNFKSETSWMDDI